MDFLDVAMQIAWPSVMGVAGGAFASWLGWGIEKKRAP